MVILQLSHNISRPALHKDVHRFEWKILRLLIRLVFYRVVGRFFQVASIDTVFTRTTVAAFIEFFALQLRRLFVGGVY